MAAPSVNCFGCFPGRTGLGELWGALLGTSPLGFSPFHGAERLQPSLLLAAAVPAFWGVRGWCLSDATCDIARRARGWVVCPGLGLHPLPGCRNVPCLVGVRM